MGNEVGIEDSDGATVGSNVGIEVDSRLPPSSSLVPGKEVGKPKADRNPAVESEPAPLM